MPYGTNSVVSPAAGPQQPNQGQQGFQLVPSPLSVPSQLPFPSSPGVQYRPLANPYPTTSGVRSNRHGSAERGTSSPAAGGQNRGRERERERDERRDQTHSPVRGAWQQTQADRDYEEDVIENRFITNENLLRRHAELIANTHQELETAKEIILQMGQKIASMDDYAKNVDGRLTTMMEGVAARYDPSSNEMYQRIQGLEERAMNFISAGVPSGLAERVTRLEELMAQARFDGPPPGMPQHFPFNSPHQEPCHAGGPPDPPNESPWDRLVRLGFNAKAENQAQTIGAYPHNLPKGQGQRPATESWEQPHPCMTQVPIGRQAPPAPQAHHSQPDIPSVFRGNNAQQVFQGYGPIGNGAQDIVQLFKIQRKDVELKKFSGNMADWKSWKNRFMDHLAQSTGRWRRLLRMVESSEDKLTKELLLHTPIGQGYSAWDLAEDLESFIIKYVADNLYTRRYTWTGGEEGNGFEMWRNLFKEYEGNHMLVKMGGRRLFDNYGKCAPTADVLKHVDGWVELLFTHGTDLLNNE